MVQGLKKNMLTLSSCYLGPQFNRTKDLWSISTVIGSVSMYVLLLQKEYIKGFAFVHKKIMIKNGFYLLRCRRLREYDNDSYRYLIPEKPKTLGT